MNLNPLPFSLIKLGKKKIEMRLNKDNRDKINKDDFIIFKNNQSQEIIKVIVTSVSKFSDFEELYKHFDKSLLGYEKDEIADPNDMLLYYSKEMIKERGVLGIGIKIIK
ncbi:MAG: ASCH domain-containing protein [Bacilli bacterium]|nr:ASCH domain-containing protein [Bacilli bacterium]